MTEPVAIEQTPSAVSAEAAGPPPAPGYTPQFAELVRINTDELATAFGLERAGWRRSALGWLARRPIHRFSRQLQTYEELVAREGLQAGSRWLIEQLVRRLEIHGLAHIPRQGPLLVVANHPGIYDATALFAALPRPDLRVVAAERPFLRALPNTASYLLSVGETPAGRLGMARRAARHLRQGGALLLFPGGQIEPDPATLPGARDTLPDWSESVEMFARLTDDLTVVPVLVSGVISPATRHHPLTRLRRSEHDRRWLAATLQLMRTSLSDLNVRLDFGAPISAANLPTNRDGTALREAVQEQMCQMIARVEQQRR
jgi:1-acyl-sn-glycerol-3-phosphate acyltransferase